MGRSPYGLERQDEVGFIVPYLIAGRPDWGLEDTTLNRLRLQTLLNRVPRHQLPKSFHGYSGSLIYLPGLHGDSGQYGFHDTTADILTYYMEYKHVTDPEGRPAATQIKLWRGALAPPGITGYVFFDVMLGERFDTLISDREQSNDGMRFWTSTMRQAVARALFVGMLDEAHVLHRYDPQTNFVSWVGAQQAWGQQSVHHERRYLISKRPFGRVTNTTG